MCVLWRKAELRALLNVKVVIWPQMYEVEYHVYHAYVSSQWGHCAPWNPCGWGQARALGV